MIVDIVHKQKIKILQAITAIADSTQPTPSVNVNIFGDVGDVGDFTRESSFEQNEIILDGQVSYGTTEELNTVYSGDSPKSDGHIMFSRLHLDEKGVTLNKNDKITEIDGRAVEYVIIEIRPRAHYGTSQLVKAFFERKQSEI